MGLFSNIVSKVLKENENQGIIRYEDIKSDYVNGPVYVFHMTGKKNLKGGILKSGWESYYNAWNSYGPGIYTCVLPSFDPRARVLVDDMGSKPNPMKDFERQYAYGLPKDDPHYGTVAGIMLLCKTLRPHPFRNFVIFDEKMAKTIYRNHWRIVDQLKLIFGKESDRIISNSPRLKYLIGKSKKAYEYLKDNNLDWSDYNELYYRANGASILDDACNNPEINKFIRGIIFHGPGDGYVAIFRDYNALEPIGVSSDLGHTFTPIEVEDEFENYQKNNIDIRSALGLDRFFFAKTDTIREEWYGKINVPFDYVSCTFFGNYAIVGKMKTPKFQRINWGTSVAKLDGYNDPNWEWNYIYKPYIGKTNNFNDLLISRNVWFDKVGMNDWDNNSTAVMKNNSIYTIKNEHNTFNLYDENGNLIGDLNRITENDLMTNSIKNPTTYNNVQQQSDINTSNNNVNIVNDKDAEQAQPTQRKFKKRIFKPRT